MRERIVLSDRMQALVSFVTAGSRVCDVGCDHAFIPIYLLQQGICPKALAMDVREGPLQQAREHIAAYGLEAYIETRLSDGLKAYREGEADSLICAGMGGRLMMRILGDDAHKTDSFRELILQPQSEIQQFRAYLRRQGYLIADENMIEEDGKFYPIMKVVCKVSEAEQGMEAVWEPGKDTGAKSLTSEESETLLWRQQMEDRYGPVLLQRKHPVLCRYIEREKRICEEVLGQLRMQGLTGSKQIGRYRELEAQIQDCLRIMEEMRYGND